MAAISQQSALFPVLEEEQMRCLREEGAEIHAAPGDTLFREGETADRFYVLLDGEVKITKQVAGGEIVLAVHHAGEFTGELSLLSGGKSIATGRVVKPSRLLELDVASLRKLLVACPWLSDVVVTAMARRRPEAELLSQQREKLASLGMMAAGLAHELNNPASAAQRAAQHLRETFHKQHELAISLCHKAFSPEQRDALTQFQRAAFESASHQSPLDPLVRSDREDELAQWLENHSVEEGWNLAPTFVMAGLDTAQLEALNHRLPEGTLCEALHWLEATLSVAELVEEVEQGTTRISELVKAIKSYSYMDQAPVQDVDVHEGLENTLTILGHKLRKGQVVVHREYDRSVPCIPAYGSELTQVWTNLLVNAIDALQGKGNIWVRTCCENDAVLVEIADDGPGISADIQPRIFDPFFTTKGVGEGTGMGLNISYRIVVERHQGDLRVLSVPGDTRFQVRLPTQKRP